MQNYAQEQSLLLMGLVLGFSGLKWNVLKVALTAFLTMKCYEVVLLCFTMRVPDLQKEPVAHISPLLYEILSWVGCFPDTMIPVQIASWGRSLRKLC